MIKQLLLGTFILMFSLSAFAQVTTASIKGVVKDDKAALPGATVVATHTPSGTQYATVTQEDGSYHIPNMRIGGPYTIDVRFVGYASTKDEGIFLQIGQKLKLNYVLKADNTTLDEVVVSAQGKTALINKGRTGASTNINNEVIKTLPTISRSINDFTRLTPGSDGLSYGGRNSLMNNLSLDGSIFNSPFGLGDGTPGGQTNAQPISLDAIDQIQVDLAPYDVTVAGFTGAAINAVTKSGTNEFHGSAFGFFRNQNLTGTKVADAQLLEVDLKHIQTGASIGGPLIKDKLFFFVNGEIERRSDLSTAFRANRGEPVGNGISRVLASDLDKVSSLLKSIGYETGPYENILLNTDNEKFIAKLDWNINANHSLTATYNILNSSRQKPAHPVAFTRRGPDQTTLQFANSGYTQHNNLQSGIVELKSRFGNKYSNNLQVGFTNFDDFRSPESVPAPPITIRKDGVPYIIAGHEPFSIHNILDQQVFQITNNFKIFSGKHIFTIGGAFEKFSFQNSFNLFGYGLGALGFMNYQSVDDFETAINNGKVAADIASAQSTFETNNRDNTWSLAESNVGQIALYGQDELSVNNNLTLTFGIRFDKPEFFNTSQLAKENI
ncbi:MAG TPA: TonB-dependent receptor, partial [Saprospiraceae bacterium]|nr:TonB-dependent receptor [Saprospiraceae bacterium]